MSFFAKLKASFNDTVDKLKGQPTHSTERLQHWKSTGIVGLRDTNIKEFPDGLEKLAADVKVIDATNNKLSQLPVYLPDMVHLQRLILSSNLIIHLPPSIGSLSNLKVLGLDNNQLQSLPDSIGQLSHLEKLTITNNHMSRLPASVGMLSELKFLVASGNSLTTLPVEIGDAAALEEIDVQNNNIVSIPASIGNLKKLKTLQLDLNGVTAIPPEVFKDCLTLQTLSLHSNPICMDTVQATEGYEQFEERRRSKYTKAIAGGVILDSKGLDEGVDRLTTKN